LNHSSVFLVWVAILLTQLIPRTFQ